MILEGNERGFGAELARHLLNPKDNDHVTVHMVDGFMAHDLMGAFAEVEAISQATQCSKYLFSLSLNPPVNEMVPVEVFEDTIDRIERKLGLVGQAKAVAFHEKNGRRHAHCVWSRIDPKQMKAITLSHYKRKLADISRELFLEHGWDMPEGFRDKAKREPNNYSSEEHGQAKREKRDPKETKALFRQCWEQSDDLTSFRAALSELGFVLARGDRRGFVAVDQQGTVWSLSRWCGVKPKDLRARLGSEDDLPSVEEALAILRKQIRDGSFPEPGQDTVASAIITPNPSFALKRAELIARQREERAELLNSQESRRIEELKARRSRLPRGLKAAFLKITGRYQELVREFEEETRQLQRRDREEQQALIDKHLTQRRVLERDVRLHGDAKDFHATLKSVFLTDPDQALDLPADDLPFKRNQLEQNPALVLDHISKTKAEFERIDVLTALAKRIDDPFHLKELADKAIQSPQLIRLDKDSNRNNHAAPIFTTLDFVEAKEKLQAVATDMVNTYGFGVSSLNRTHAIQSQNAKMKREFGGSLSKEQQSALDHILDKSQFASIVGLAGAGKSTLLNTANEAWGLQGITVHGAALAGKAADGLETASAIQSRTLASLETSWENGNEPISKGAILVIDEAGMIGTRQLSRIAAKIREIGAKLVLVGDPDQLQPIEAGTPFRDLVKSHKAAQLTEIHRQHEEWQRDVSREFANGNIADALQSYAERGCIKHSKNRDEAIEALVEAYTMDVAANGTETTRLAFAHRRKDVHALNQAIRAALKEIKKLNDNESEPVSVRDVLLTTETGKRAFAEGDRIVFSRNDKTLGVKNGMLVTVKTVSKKSVTVELDGEPSRELTFDPRRYESFDHGYAVTIHKSQGATVDQSYVLASRSMDRHLAYVAMTRHREDMSLYINNKDQPSWVLHRHGDLQHEQRTGVENKGKVRTRSGPSIG